MSLRRYAQTDEQEEALSKVEDWSEKANFNLMFGTSVGKSPQTVILDHKYQDSCARVTSDGVISIDDIEICSYQDFVDAVNGMKKEEDKDPSPEGYSPEAQAAGCYDEEDD